MTIFIFDVPKKENSQEWMLNAADSKAKCIYAYKKLAKIYSVDNKHPAFGKVWANVIRIYQCLKAILISDRYDNIVVWEHGTGILLSDISAAFGLKRNIVIFNWLEPYPQNTSEKYYKRLKRAGNNSRCRNIIDMASSRKKWMDYLECKDTFRYIPDVYKINYNFEPAKKTVNYRFCFSGGLTNRDWKLLRDIAAITPDIRYICVASKRDFLTQVKDTVPQNMKILFNVPIDEYAGLMKQAAVVLLPLKEETISGLVNIIASAENNLLCCASKYEFTLSYFPPNSECLVENNAESWAAEINRLWNLQEEEKLKISQEFKTHIFSNFSSEYGTELLSEVLKEFSK